MATQMNRIAEAEPLLTAIDVAGYLGVPVATVYAWNSRGLGPKRFRVGKYVRYRRTDVDAWLDRQAPGVTDWPA